PEMGTHTVTFGREVYIDAEDFMEVPAKKFQRMYPGFEVRLKGAYIVKCEGCTKDEDGNIVEVQCTVDFDSASGTPGADRKIKGKVLHWVSAADAVPFEARLYEPLLADEGEAAEETAEEPVVEEIVDVEEEADAEEDALTRKDYDFLKQLNPNSLTILNGFVEPCVLDSAPGTTYQFLRTGYFCKDPDSTAEKPVFNRTVGLRDTFAKQVKK
ncbi:MAG: glutamine--tRNA ligase, partial [Ruminococcaceae bacterium]|nr:glutamine--tRNA ligase [Oscillospiraceae bacterium]